MSSLEIESQLIAVSDGLTVLVTADGKTGLVRCPEFNFRKDAKRIFPLFFASKKLFQLLHKIFAAENISCSFELRGRQVMKLGYLSRPGFFSRLFRLGAIELNIFQIFALAFDSTHTRPRRT